MRSIDNNDLEATNVEFIEFWMLDPFLYNTTSPGGKLFFNLGNISEDILRDSRMSYENGIVEDTSTMDKTFWGWVPKYPSLVDAFTLDQTPRAYRMLVLTEWEMPVSATANQPFLLGLTTP